MYRFVCVQGVQLVARPVASPVLTSGAMQAAVMPATPSHLTESVEVNLNLVYF